MSQEHKKRSLVLSRGRRVLCADGFYRVIVQANLALVCNGCGKTLKAGSWFTLRRLSKERKLEESAVPVQFQQGRSPVCQRCGPFGARVEVRQAITITVKQIKMSDADAQEARSGGCA